MLREALTLPAVEVRWPVQISIRLPANPSSILNLFLVKTFLLSIQRDT